MKKKITCGILFFVMCFAVCTAGSYTITAVSRSETQAFKLELEPRGTCNMAEINCSVFRFAPPNEDLCVYNVSDIYIVANVNGDAYGNIIYTDSSQFVAISPDYILLLTENGLTAFEFPFVNSKVIAYDRLTQKEKSLFVYPRKYERIN